MLPIFVVALGTALWFAVRAYQEKLYYGEYAEPEIYQVCSFLLIDVAAFILALA